MKLPHLSGEVNFIKGRMQEAVQGGLPDVGWRGDPLLEVIFDYINKEWQVIDYACSPPQLAVSKKHEKGLRELDMIPALCKKLVKADAPARSVVERLANREDAIYKEREERDRAHRIQVVEELLPAIKFDLR